MTTLLVSLAAALPFEEGHAGELSVSRMMTSMYEHMSAHRYSDRPFLTLGPVQFYWTNHDAALLVAAGLVLAAFGWLAWCRRRRLEPTGPLQNMLEAMVLFVRDDMVYANMGKEYGRRFLPLFLTQFFCILIMNLMGILPNLPRVGFLEHLHLPTTATANLAVTGGLALVTFLTILYGGIRQQGFGHFVKGLAPHVDLGDSPTMKAMRVGILGILYPIELLGLLIKPVALMIRLFANMTGGHLAMLTIYGLIFVFSSYVLSSVGVAFNVFLTFLELLVAFIQAYIFTYLSIIFVGAAVHPEH